MRSWGITIYSTLFATLIFLVIFICCGFNEESVRINIRLSARFSAILFWLAFSSSSIHFFLKNQLSFCLLHNRKFFGLGFANVHLIHLLFLIILQFRFHPVFEMAAASSIIGGGLAYVFLILMYITSFHRFSSLLKPNHWSLLHTIGGYWIWLIFFISYMKRVDTEIEYLPMVLIFITTIVLRLSKMIIGLKVKRV